VVSLAVDDDGVGVGLDDGRSRYVSRYRAVLCTIPFSVLRGVAVDGIDDDKRQVLAAVDYGGATKIALHCREPFWTRSGIAGGASATGGRLRQTYYPPVEGDPRLGAALLASYAIAEDAAVLGALPEPERHAAAVEEAAALHPELREPGMVLGAASLAWDGYRWSKGCTARRWGKTATETAEEIRRAARRQGGLFFAGEHCSSMPAWINGAIESALTTVAEVDAFTRDPQHAAHA
jgi:monoamine oxidase